MALHPETRIGHVHLKVADLSRSLRFYRDLLGRYTFKRISSRSITASLSLASAAPPVASLVFTSEG